MFDVSDLVILPRNERCFEQCCRPRDGYRIAKIIKIKMDRVMIKDLFQENSLD